MNLRDLSDDDLAAGATSGLSGLGNIVESNRRLREAILEEERAIKRLTKWLVAMTGVLVLMTGALIWLTLKIFQHG